MRLASLPAAAILAAWPVCAQSAPRVTPPKEALGFNIGDDYHLASYSQLASYWKKLASESDRMKLVDMGPTAEGRRQIMAVITSPENQKKLDRLKEISRRLALAEGLSEEQAHALAREGKAVVWIDGGLHATETVGSQQLMELVYEMVSRTDPETMRFLNDVVLLCVPANPDGLELVANWYMRHKDPLKRTFSGLPRLYHKYIGHDDNRDFYMSTMPETTNMNRQLFMEWFPQIMYNHHQSGPAGTVIFMPPFRDPFNYNFDPLIPLGVEMVATAMHSRLVAEGKGGSVMRGAANYSTWWNGGLRTITYFHNMIGILTEIIGSPTPMNIPLVAEKQLPSGDWPLPIKPQQWHFRQSIEYSMTNDRAMLDIASRYRETFLFNIWRMGMNSIEKGSRDNWTITPKRIAALQAAAAKERAAAGGDAPPSGPRQLPAELYGTVLHDPNARDPRGYIIPADQPDFPTATVFINTLLKTGITVLQATAPFQVAGKSYPARSYVVKAAQAFRPHVMDMFEPQDHPNDFRYPGGPPNPPYDTTGWTLALQMGVKFDRILDGFDGPFARVTSLQESSPAAITGVANPAGYLISHRVNNSFRLVNRLLKAHCDVYWLGQRQSDLGTGAIWVPAAAAARPVLERGARELGIAVHAAARPPAGDALKLKPPRIGLYDVYGGSMTSGWTRWLLEQFEFPFTVVYPQTLDDKDLSAGFDVLVFTDGAIRRGAAPRGGRPSASAAAVSDIPAEYRGRTGRITDDKTAPRLKKFVEGGGALVAIGSSSISIAGMFGLPVRNYLSEKAADGKDRPLPREEFFIPGSLLRMCVDPDEPVAYGMPEQADVFYNNSPLFRLDPPMKGVHSVAWFAGPKVLDSGWAWGQQYLDGATAVAQASLGDGKVFLFGPEVAFRAQPHGTFKLLFNSLYYGAAKPARLR